MYFASLDNSESSSGVIRAVAGCAFFGVGLGLRNVSILQSSHHLIPRPRALLQKSSTNADDEGTLIPTYWPNSIVFLLISFSNTKAAMVMQRRGCSLLRGRVRTQNRNQIRGAQSSVRVPRAEIEVSRKPTWLVPDLAKVFTSARPPSGDVFLLDAIGSFRPWPGQ